MATSHVLVLAFGIGIIAGLRSLTAPAVVAWGGAAGLAQPPRHLAGVYGIDGGGGNLLCSCRR